MKQSKKLSESCKEVQKNIIIQYLVKQKW